MKEFRGKQFVDRGPLELIVFRAYITPGFLQEDRRGFPGGDSFSFDSQDVAFLHSCGRVVTGLSMERTPPPLNHRITGTTGSYPTGGEELVKADACGHETAL